MGTYEDAEAICKIIRSKVSFNPQVGIICGSGLGTLAETVQEPIVIKYSEIPQFPRSTVVGHAGNLVFGKLSGKHVMVMQGRFHPYEGYEMSQVTLPVRVMKLMGVEFVFVTNAAGGLNSNYKVGDIMVIKDHINLPALSGKGPLIGKNDERFGPRFPSTSEIYTPSLRKTATQIAQELKITHLLHEGVYAACSGPAYETPAEARMLKTLGADVLGMSTAHETTCACHAGMKVFAMSLVTNSVVTDYDSKVITNHEEVLQTSKLRAETMKEFLTKMVSSL